MEQKEQIAAIENPVELTPIEENFIDSKVEFNGNDYKLMFSVPLEKINYNKVNIKINKFFFILSHPLI